MVMDAAEAESLIATRDRTGRLLVVGLPGQPVAAGPDRGADDRGRRDRADPQHRRGRVAGLAGQLGRDLAGQIRRCPAAASCSTRARTCSTRSATSPASRSPRSRRGSRTTAAPVDIRGRGHGPTRVRGARHPERLRSRHPVAAARTSGCSASGRPSGPGSGARRWRSSATASRRRRHRRRSSREPSGSSSLPCATGASPTRVRPRSACAWPACGMRSGRRRRPGVPSFGVPVSEEA